MVNGIDYALTRVHRAENRTHRHLLAMVTKYADEAEIRHVAVDLAGWSEEHIRVLAGAASDLGLNLDDEADTPNLLAQQLRSLAATITPRDTAALELLADLCELFLRASDSSLHWEMLAQVAQAERNTELLALSSTCHPQTLRQIRWANTLLKSQTPQILAAL